MHGTQLLRRAVSLPLAAARGVGGGYRWLVLSGRWVVVVGWVVLAVLAGALVPASPGGGGGFNDLAPAGSPVVAAQERSLQLFRVPVVSGTTVVVHEPGGMSTLTRADSVLWALAHTQASLEGTVPDGPGQILAAVPVPTADPDTAVTYLYMSEGTGLMSTTRLARQYAAHFANQASVRAYVTGLQPAQIAVGEQLRARLPLFELVSILLVVCVVALVFRSVVAPVVVIVVVAAGYVLQQSTLSLAATALGTEVPSQLEPVLTALLLGVITDYCVLFFSTARETLAAGGDRRSAALAVVSRDTGVVAVAGLTVAGGTVALLAAPFELFTALGPALALTVLVGLLVSLTLAPALVAILGRWLFAPSSPKDSHRGEAQQSLTDRLVRPLTRQPWAALALVVGLAALGVAALPLQHGRLSLSFTAALPSDDRVARGAQVLGDAGLRGLTAPTEVLVEGAGVTDQRAALARAQSALARQPGVALVLGPASSPVSQPRGVVLSDDGNAARFLVVLRGDPLAAPAAAQVRALQEQVPGLMREAGLTGVRTAVTGQSAIAADVADATRASLLVVVLVALAIELVILALYLRALVAPVALLLVSLLSVASALGLTVLVFEVWLGEPGLTFYAPFATAVLLLALGSDYNVFAVGAIWDEASRRPLREAIATAMPRSARAITAAGLILAATFAVVAVVPLSTFRQIAFTMSVGLLLDTLLVRPVLTPALLTTLGRWAGWPGRRTAPRPAGAR